MAVIKVREPASAALREQIFDDFRSRLSKALALDHDLALYGIIPEIQKYFNSSRHFLNVANAFISDFGNSDDIIQFQSDISEATQRMEASAQKCLIERLSICSDEQKTRVIRLLGEPNSDLRCPILNFERIPELQQERTISGIGENSSVLILGAGSISVSGLYFASHGARVTLLDRDSRAIEKFRSVHDLLPREIRDRITFDPACDARDYAFPQDVTHICLAALLEPKEPIIDKIRIAYGSCKAPLTVLIRTPRQDLMRLFYYDVDSSVLAGFKLVGKVDIGYEEQPANTLVMRLEY